MTRVINGHRVLVITAAVVTVLGIAGAYAGFHRLFRGGMVRRPPVPAPRPVTRLPEPARRRPPTWRGPIDVAMEPPEPEGDSTVPDEEKEGEPNASGPKAD